MKEKIYGIAAGVLGVPAEKLDSGSSMESIASWTSISHLQLVAALEESLGITFSEEEILEMTSLGRIAEIVASRG